MDFEKDGNHEIECPECHHIHYRVVENGRITGVRYRSSMTTVAVWNVAITTYTASTGGNYYTQWLNDTTTNSWATIASTTSGTWY